MAKVLEERIPLFGELKISLNKEAELCYDKLEERGEIDRLKNKVMHLGIIHEIGDVPSFGRWVHVVAMLKIIEEVKKTANTETLGFGYPSEVNLLNKTKFSSAEEFLKCWAMLYSIGHFIGTFTSEHAFLRSILRNKDEFINCLNSGIDDPLIKDTFQEIIRKERVFRIFKIFTTLKILDIFKDYDECLKYVELAKLNLLEDSYLENVNNAIQRTKLGNLLYFFKLVRKLSFTILDGYFSQNCVVPNHYYFLLNIDKILREKQYDQLLNNLNLFYTQTIYQSPENMFYHHEFAKVIKKEVFDKENKWDKLIQDILGNKIDDNIRNAIDANKERIKKKKVKHFGRIILKSIDGPVSLEEETFRDIFGGIIWNIPGEYYEVDFYIKQPEQSSSLKDILSIFKAVRKIYKNVDRDEKIKNFEEISKEIVLKTLKTISPEYEFACDNRRYGFYSVLFDKENIDKVYGLIDIKINDQKIGGDTKKELKTSKELLQHIIGKIKTETEDIFIFSPNLISKGKDNNIKSECDFLLMSFSSKKFAIYLSEIKSNLDFEKSQIQNYFTCFLGLNEEDSKKYTDELFENKNLSKKNLKASITKNWILITKEFRIT